MSASSPPPQEVACLPLLADPDHYRACLWDLATDAPMFRHWISVFEDHLPFCLEEAVAEGPGPKGFGL